MELENIGLNPLLVPFKPQQLVFQPFEFWAQQYLRVNFITTNIIFGEKIDHLVTKKKRCDKKFFPI